MKKSKFKVGQRIKLVKPDEQTISNGGKKGKIFTIGRIEKGDQQIMLYLKEVTFILFEFEVELVTRGRPRKIIEFPIEVKEDKSKQIILLSKKHIMALRHKLLRKESPVWVELRENIEEQADFCLHCGKDK